MASSTPPSLLRTPRAAAIAGVAFALILGAVIVLLRGASLEIGADPQLWLTSESRRSQVSWALNLIPFAGIAFLWFIGVIRSRLGAAEDQLFATVFLGSGLLFVSMLFVSAAAIGTVLTVSPLDQPASVETVRLLTILNSTITGVFATRMAAVFTLAVTTSARRAGLLPRWLLVAGLGCALGLLLCPPSVRWIQLLFPLWVLSISIHILVVTRRAPRPGEVEWA